MDTRTQLDRLGALPHTPKLPVFFMGHGSPMNAVEENAFTAAWSKSTEHLSDIHAILCISAHWQTKGTHVDISERPKQVYDFYGFPDALYNIRYAPLGAPEIARVTTSVVTRVPVQADTTWGLDHGGWVVLQQMFPGAQIPTFQLSIDMTASLAQHIAIGKELAVLREHGVLIVASGNIVHNLYEIDFAQPDRAFDWALEFDAKVHERIMAGDISTLAALEQFGAAGKQSVPTTDHYIPLLYALGAADGDTPSSLVSGIVYGSVSMRAYRFG